MIEDIIKKSKLDFLNEIKFVEKTPGRFFQEQKTDIGNGWYQFYVILGPNIESPIHNHNGQNMEETHMLLWGSGKFIIYSPQKETELILRKNEFHKIFSTKNITPDHKYVAGQEGSVTLALEKHYN